MKGCTLLLMDVMANSIVSCSFPQHREESILKEPRDFIEVDGKLPWSTRKLPASRDPEAWISLCR